MKIELLNHILSLYYTHTVTGNEVRFGPIRHSEYTIEFHLIEGKWNIEGNDLIYSDVREKYEYEDSYNTNVNGYVNESEATHVLTIAAYIAEDGVLTIMSS
jgi:hypothetical protein